MLRIRNAGGVRSLPFLYVQAVSDLVTNVNSVSTKIVSKWNCALGFCIQFSVFGTTTVAKVNLFST